MSRKFYFTFGTGGAYSGGWVEVIADNMKQAYGFFEARFPKLVNGCFNFCACYSKQDFIKTGMYENGNFGYRCHEVLGILNKEKAPTEAATSDVDAHSNNQDKSNMED